MRGEEPPEQPFSRSSAFAFLIIGYIASIGVGLFISWHAQDFFNDILSLNQPHGVVAQSSLLFYSPPVLLAVDLVLYPPIAVLIVDSMHALASHFD